MAKLPSIKRIVKEDIQDAPEWIDQLISPLNTFMEEVYFALDNQLSIGDNIRGSLTKITVRTLSTYGNTPVTDNWEVVNINNPIGVRPQIVSVGQVTDLNTFLPVIDPVGVAWDFLNGIIRLKYISGLEPSKKYEINLLIF
jgi:hypothetical protein